MKFLAILLLFCLSVTIDESLGDDNENNWKKPKKYVKDLEFDWKTALDLHNYYRRRVASGKAGKQPAGLIPDLIYDPELAKAAQQWSQKCWDSQHSDRNESKAGENMAYNYPPPIKDWTIEEKLNDSITGWFNEQNDFTYGLGGRFILHYTTLVWANTKKVGCGLSKCQHWDPLMAQNDGWFLVCQYSPRANWPGECPKNDTTCYQNLTVKTPYPKEGKPLEQAKDEGSSINNKGAPDKEQDKTPSVDKGRPLIPKDQGTPPKDDQRVKPIKNDDENTKMKEKGAKSVNTKDLSDDYHGDEPIEESGITKENKNEKVENDQHQQNQRSDCYDSNLSANEIVCDLAFWDETTLRSGQRTKYEWCWAYKCRANKVRQGDLPFCNSQCNEDTKMYFESEKGRKMIRDFERNSIASKDTSNRQQDFADSQFQQNQQQQNVQNHMQDQMSDCYDPRLTDNEIICDSFRGRKTPSGQDVQSLCWSYKCRANKVRFGDLFFCNSQCNYIIEQYFESEEGKMMAEEFKAKSKQ